MKTFLLLLLQVFAITVLPGQINNVALVSIYGDNQINAPFFANAVNAAKVLADNKAFSTKEAIDYTKEKILSDFGQGQFFIFIPQEEITANKDYQLFGEQFVSWEKEKFYTTASDYYYIPILRRNIIALSDILEETGAQHFMFVETHFYLKRWNNIFGITGTVKAKADITIQIFAPDGKRVLHSHATALSQEQIRYWFDGAFIKQEKITQQCKKAADIAMEKIKQDLKSI